jgi:hypothetical protein
LAVEGEPRAKLGRDAAFDDGEFEGEFAVVEQTAVVRTFGCFGFGGSAVAVSAVGVTVVIMTGGGVIVAGLDDEIGGGTAEGDDGKERKWVFPVHDKFGSGEI